ncbi:tRNA (uridine(34)/cytosine(34)/5-carboxymethylaminomethyluridine(34)-2'-O)-methyltransferase TrmL [Burkholderia glumae]|uniref:tRNA (cytidine(34)-2'-O)-methyltransferase n=1 Tax=Burkholderia glumae TaxID=337 RepID=A0AAQ0BSK5_BURGL|nr:tRNA (uridine(34)/cytosine(34)/5-carboxymethylaminomethyluridine(34)-2'-O)-methyltransferase TrmL [Burkholderia glumae]ACR30236.1 TrmH family RNA methyltransferase [Burkholderia glumae BGR1]AJY67536.1 tRNA (cytidine(34)-2'-O)-methyltransferase [Burkholderia glumae LMG 2196 = ATCC 33617]KHJ64908.1 rRNA methylase [Burkholderia glumae]MCM2482118.1 tRNA (uridine(34)/cytosine(34)/5-carboxymethylaminomethyluridine(34)-2'-O)-methyltransferase TrmL [Burkholderia glumae]MCM2491285.1 tRNA (uridine(34
MFNVVLVEPEIPPNTGNVIRLCANTGARLHLVEPLGFPLEDAKLRRAGLDYHEYARMHVHRDWEALLAAEQPDPARMFAFTTRGSGRFHDRVFRPGDWFVFGAETRGLGEAMLARFPDEQRVRLPMRPDNRSLNLSNTVAVVVFEAWRQAGFEGGE